jgi:hypothetical protein
MGSCGAYIGAIAQRQAIRRNAEDGPAAEDALNYNNLMNVNPE